MTIVQYLTLSGNPFEHYTAETEPDISKYAIRPPYLQTISSRALNLSSFILFGNRGAGKSATRITVFSEIWKTEHNKDNKKPLVVNLTDYTKLLNLLITKKLTDISIINLVAFNVIEQTLAWLSSFDDNQREIYINKLSDNDRTLILALLKGFYLNVPELDRDLSNTEALKLLNSAWYTSSSVWIGKQWDSLSTIMANIVNAFSKKEINDSIDITAASEALLKSLKGETASTSKAILTKLVDLVQAFGFSGICVLVDKVDETPATDNSAEATASLIHPLLSHIQLLEVHGFAWIMFLWSNVQDHFHSKYPVRLDKIANARISWTEENLKEMTNERISFFSNKKHSLNSLFSSEIDIDSEFKNIIHLSTFSPRELIKLLDIIIREHDLRTDNKSVLIDNTSLNIGKNKYALENINYHYKEDTLQQLLRLGKIEFVNKDVQKFFNISDQGARNRITGWENSGLVIKSGTALSDRGGKPVAKYTVNDARVERIISKKLSSNVGVQSND